MRLSVHANALLLSALLCGCVGPFNDESVEKRKELSAQLASLVLNSTLYDQVIDASVQEGADQAILKMQEQFGISLSEREDKEYRDAFRSAFLKTYPKSDWETSLSAYYYTSFSGNELSQIVKFYRTPVSAKWEAAQSSMEYERIVRDLVLSKSKEFETNLASTLEVYKFNPQSRARQGQTVSRDLVVSRLEAIYPELNPKSDRYNQRFVDAIIQRHSELTKIGVSDTDALIRAARDVMGANGNAQF